MYFQSTVFRKLVSSTAVQLSTAGCTAGCTAGVQLVYSWGLSLSMHPAVGGSQPSVDTADTAHSSGHAYTGHAPATQPSQGAADTRTLATHSE